MEHSTAITKHKNFPQMLSIKSATCERVITKTGIIFAADNRIYCLHQAINVQTLERPPNSCMFAMFA